MRGASKKPPARASPKASKRGGVFLPLYKVDGLKEELVRLAKANGLNMNAAALEAVQQWVMRKQQKVAP
jgi:hypothetical protein